MLQDQRRKSPYQYVFTIVDSFFDSMWQEEVINNIFEAGVEDNKLALLHEINKTSYLAVKIQHGLTERKQTNRVICQGDPWGPMECSV